MARSGLRGGELRSGHPEERDAVPRPGGDRDRLDAPYLMVDLLTGRTSRERGADLAVLLDPAGEAFRIFTVAPIDH